MTGKQNAIFWIGLFMILINFWVSGQSAILWGTLSGKPASSGSNTSQGPPQKPGRGVKPGPGHPDPHGFVQ